jgi:hypothetical protein
MPKTSPQRKARRDDEFKWRATTWRRRAQWRRWEFVGLKPSMGIDELELKWVDPSIPGVDILNAASSIQLERTIDGPSVLTITVKDPWQTLFARGRTGRTSTRRLTPAQRRAVKRRKLAPIDLDEAWDPISPPYLRGRSAEVSLDGATFRLVKIGYSHLEEEATLTFEDEIVYLLKRKYGARRASRKKVTRAQFVLSQLREVKRMRPPFICPELMVKQPIDRPDSTGSTSKRTSSGGSGGDGGFSPNADLHGMDHNGSKYPITGDKRRNAATVLATADEITDNRKARLALVEACNIENQWSNAARGDRDSQGILQVRRNMHGAKATDIPWCVGRFLKGPSWTGAEGGKGAIALAKAHPDWSAGKIAQTIQGSAYPERYDKTKPAAEALLRAWGGAGGSSEGSGASGGGSYTKSYQYSRKRGESAYGSITRLAEEVGWRFYIVGRAVYFMSEEQLYNRRIRYTFKPGDNTILDLSYDIDWGKPVSECSLSVTLDRWGAPPGSVVELAGWDMPDGRWLVSSIRRDWFKPVAEVTLRQPGKAKMEPASEKVTRASTSSSGGTSTTTDPDATTKTGKLLAISKTFDHSYVYGGGHGPALSSMSVHGPLDCSSSCSLALYKAGMWDSMTYARVSGGFSNWGRAGRGENHTVWYNNGHVFIHFEGDYKGRFDTGGHPGVSGPRYVAEHRSTAGFQPRHWGQA